MKTVVVTGITSGIGRQIAIDLANIGYVIAGIYKNDDKSATSLEKEYCNIITYKCDISKTRDVRNTAEKILSEHSNIYAIINNAGISHTSLFNDTSEEDFDNIFNTNVKGAFSVTKAFLPSLIKNKKGRIINISSIWGVFGGSCEVIYSASKAAIIGMTKALARELGPSEITVNCIAPGVIETKMLSNLTENDKLNLAQNTALLRNGTPKDISGIAEFLLSDKSDFITAQVITADGGMI